MELLKPNHPGLYNGNAPPMVRAECDHFDSALVRCKIPPIRAPRVVVPAVDFRDPEHKPLKMMTTLHYCELHKGELKLEDLLNEKVKVGFEETAKRKRPIGFKCDFDTAFIEWVLMTTPEYREWMLRLGGRKILELARANS